MLFKKHAQAAQPKAQHIYGIKTKPKSEHSKRKYTRIIKATMQQECWSKDSIF